MVADVSLALLPVLKTLSPIELFCSASICGLLPSLIVSCFSPVWLLFLEGLLFSEEEMER